MIKVGKKSSKKKVRVNITVDKEMLDKAKGKLELFGGKLSTLFNAYLSDFVTSMDKKFNENQKVLGQRVDSVEADLDRKVKELEKRVKKVEKKS